MNVGVALGSNLGDRLANLRQARNAILRLTGVSRPILSSSIYETEPVDCEPGAAKFLNAVLQFDYQGQPVELWRELKRIESKMGRPPQHERNVSRTIDLDLICFGDVETNTGELILPHPRAHERRFVLQPLADVAPELVLPGQTQNVRELLASLGESATVVRLTDNWECR
jgi:2-amino-4-hydroxy-6-hydroxymethyldihydropteridine diphosphokinase